MPRELSNSSLHHILIRKIIDDGYAPDNQFLARYFETSINDVERALKKLEEYHGIVLHPHEPKVWVIHPFSLAPTNFYIRSGNGEWWGNCAWCSLGVAALINEDLTISTTLGAEGEPITIRIENGDILEKNLYIHFPIAMKEAWNNVLYTCSNMLIFQNQEQVQSWCSKHNIPEGDIQPIDKIWAFSKKWYGNHLNPEWTKWTMEEAKALFEEFDLNHPIWQLETSAERF